jgi:hypothetical protein
MLPAEADQLLLQVGASVEHAARLDDRFDFLADDIVGYPCRLIAA